MSKDKINDFIEGIKYVEDTSNEFKELIVELKDIGERMMSNFKDSKTSDERIDAQIHMERELETVIKNINHRPILVYHNGEISRLSVFSVNLPARTKGKEAFSDSHRLYLNIFGISFVKLLGVDNNYNKETLSGKQFKIKIGGNKNLILGAGIFNMTTDRVGISRPNIGDVGYPLARTRYGTRYVQDTHHEYKDGNDYWVSYRGDSEKDVDAYNRGEHGGEKLDWNTPQGEGYEINPINDLVDEIHNAKIGNLMEEYKDKPMIENTIEFDELDNMNFYKHQLDDILNTRENMGATLDGVPSFKTGVERNEGVIETYQYMVLNIIRSVLEPSLEDEDKRECIVNTIKDSIVHFMPSQGYVQEFFYYDEDKDKFEVDRLGGTYVNGIKMDDILGEKKNLELSKDVKLRIGNIMVVESVLNDTTQRGVLSREMMNNRKVKPLNTIYVYTRDKKFKDEDIVGIAPFLRGTGVVNSIKNRTGATNDGDSRIKYLIINGEPTAISTAEDYRGRSTPMTVLNKDDRSIKNYTVNTVDEIFPLKQGLFSAIDVFNEDYEPLDRYIDENDLSEGLDSYKVGGEFENPTKYFSDRRKSNKRVYQLVKQAPLNRKGVSHLSELMENRGLMCKVYQDIDITSNENIVRYE